MLRVNDAVLTNEEIVKRLGGDDFKITGQIEFCLIESMRSTIKILNAQDEANYVHRYPATFGLNNTHTCRNFETGGQETFIYYSNIVGDANKGFRYHTAQDLNKIMFGNGSLIVKPGQEDLLLFLRSAEANQTNKYWEIADKNGVQMYRPQKAFLFKEIIPIKESAMDYQQTIESLRAQTYAVNPEKLTHSRAIDIAIGYGMTNATTVGEKSVRVFLKKKAELNPIQFMKDVESAAFEIKAKVQSALNMGIIQFDSPYISWNLANRTGDKRICTVPAGQDFSDYFVHWMREIDKTGVMNQLSGEIITFISKKDVLEVDAENSDYKQLLKKAGVGSMNELMDLVKKAKAVEAESETTNDEQDENAPPKKKAGRPPKVVLT